MGDYFPIHFLQHAWNDTHSDWGKACTVLFYLYIWFGWDCYYQGLSDYAAELWVVFLRALNTTQFGFFLYAHREGIKVWNVSMVFVFNAILTWINLSPDFTKMEGAPPSCDWYAMRTAVWVIFWWTVSFLLCSIAEEGSKPRGSPSPKENPIVHQ